MRWAWVLFVLFAVNAAIALVKVGQYSHAEDYQTSAIYGALACVFAFLAGVELRSIMDK